MRILFSADKYAKQTKFQPTLTPIQSGDTTPAAESTKKQVADLQKLNAKLEATKRAKAENQWYAKLMRELGAN